MGVQSACELCTTSGGELLWSDQHLRVVAVAGAEGKAFPGFCRVIWSAHVAEMSDLPTADARHLMDVVMATERALRHLLAPHKINLASLGNVVPHLHWHVIPRWRDDTHFPRPIWAAAERGEGDRPVPASAVLRAALLDELSAPPFPTIHPGSPP